MSESQNTLPLSGIRVLDWSQIVMGPCCSMILADMGAEVIKIEKAPEGDDTRRMGGIGLGFFPMFNRNKKSIAINLKDDKGKEVLRKLIASADVFIENFAPGAADRLGFGYEACAKINPRLIYCALKGFMPGPYENRPSLDNIAQVMGGMAFMTGPVGTPLRAGASITDITGGAFGAMGIITAIYEREKTGKGNYVISTLFESTAFMVAQHMAGSAVSGEKSVPMPGGKVGWAVYDFFETADGDEIFIGLTSDGHWKRFCDTFGFSDLKDDPKLATNSQRAESRDWLLPKLKETIVRMPNDKVTELCEKASIPFAPLARPDELFNDKHLNESGGLVETQFPNGIKTKMPKIPMRIDGYDFGLRLDPPVVGQYGKGVMKDIGFSDDEIAELIEKKVVVVTD
ncbi:MAG: CoA transferase [Deltaproteobacteria bacterium]|nr:CoA transferase [Deltaproteobacteria bacterium]